MIKQTVTCDFCGKELLKDEEYVFIDTEQIGEYQGKLIFCKSHHNPSCIEKWYETHPLVLP